MTAADTDGAGHRRSPGHRVTLALCLPRDGMSVPVIRHVVRFALDEVGVVSEISDDIEIALTEACGNVLHHAGPGDAYDISVTIGPERCELRVVDVGRGFDHASVTQPPRADDDVSADRGRGLGLMHALVDHIELVSAPEEGTLVHLVKDLAFDDSAPARRLFSADFEPYPISTEPDPTMIGDAVPDPD